MGTPEGLLPPPPLLVLGLVDGAFLQQAVEGHGLGDIQVGEAEAETQARQPPQLTALRPYRR